MTDHKRTFAPLLLALLVGPTVFAACSSSAAPIPSGAALSCMATSATRNPGRLTLSTTDPALPPWFGGDPNVETIDMPAGKSGWAVGNPYSWEGFEDGVAHSMANAMGFKSDKTDWVKSTVADALGPTAKPFDAFIGQVPTGMATANVDMSDPYYSSPEAVVTVTGRSVAAATSVSALATYKLGAVAGSAGEQVVNSVVKPAAPVTTFPDLAAALSALTANTVDAVVVNAETAFYIRDGFAEDNTAPAVANAAIVGRFPTSAWSDDYAFVLPKGSALTPCVNLAIDEIKRQGLIDEYISEDITNPGSIPQLQ